MAESKFAGLRAVRRVSALEPDPLVPAAVSGSSTVPEPAKGKGRLPGKRSNPEWKLYSHFLKKQTQREATAILLAEDDGRDLSDILQELLENWISAPAHRRKDENPHS